MDKELQAYKSDTDRKLSELQEQMQTQEAENEQSLFEMDKKLTSKDLKIQALSQQMAELEKEKNDLRQSI